ncbi:MAG TPA: long-chain fatty acid--CoA ligase, partial [Hyphomonadaceae bacterium]|nr:long-chain fatty acid--CoA ligase [Hyphomonadaceae bacterium]
MLGLMQDWPLTVDKILDHAQAWFPKREVVTRSLEGPISRTTYGNIWRRAKQVTNALKGEGIALGDRVATLAWNTERHMEVWYGAMGMGAVLHTVNPRLFPEQIAWIVNHAEDKILFLDTTFVPTIEKVAGDLRTVKAYVILTDREHMPKTTLPNAMAYEDFIEGHGQAAAWGGFDENTACGLCYTSGTTGDPKGVLYSHRSNLLHALAANQTDCFGAGANDVVLPVVPMFHANAWAIAFVAPMCGAKLVMPGAKLDGASVYELLESEKVTFTAAVPTVWLMLLNYLRETNSKLTTLKRVAIGGSAVPEAVLRAFEDDYGVEVVHAWGMTEMSPIGTIGKLLPEHYAQAHEAQIKAKLKQGRALFTVDMKVVDDENREKPRDGKAFGRLVVKGPAVARAYFKNAGARNAKGECLEADGFFDTGDVATLDELGIMQITDRAKDVIKSGGEWISSIDIENIAVGCEGVANAAVIGVAHPKWDERPLLIVEPKPGANPTKEQVLAFLEGKIAK